MILTFYKKNKEGVSKSLKKVYSERKQEIIKKRSSTLKEKYGINSDEVLTSPFAIKSVQEKVKDTIKEKYGVDNVFKLSKYRSNRTLWQKRSVEYQKTRGYDIEYIKNELNEYQILVHNGCKIHGDILVPLGVFNNRTKDNRKNDTILCLDCNPFYSQTTTIENTIKCILDELNIAYEQHDRTQINPFELDFYIPDFKIAIECNGFYWHAGEENKYKHKNKSKLCKDKGIRLLYFWEDTIRNKSEIIKNYLKSVFQLNEKIYARKCEIREVFSNEAKKFINANHLQGYVNSNIKLGLYYNNTLVEIMTFGKNRICTGIKPKENEYELYRFCSKGGLTVVGGAEKILKYFIQHYNPYKIITYSSNDISDGKIYEVLGFKFVKNTEVGYSYINRKTGERKNRFSLRKDKINDNSGRTADEILKEKGWLKCYNTGNKKYEMIFI